MDEVPPKKSKRNITDQEIALIKTMLRRGMSKTTVQAYFTHPDRPVNYGRITNIEEGSYGPNVVAATDAELDTFLEGWRSKGDLETEKLAEKLVDLSTLPPTDAKRLEALFERADDGRFILRGGETDEIECKLSFHKVSTDKLLRAVAALANNRGGYVLFGVRDDDGVLAGLKDGHFKTLDPSAFAMSFRSAMEPCPRFEIGWAEFGGGLLGAVYVYKESDGPVIATKDDQNFKAGVTYYRYPGESRAIAGADFRRLLAERDRRARHEAGELAKRVIELGADGAMLDFRTGQIEGRSGSLFVSPELLQKMQFIREGEFVQKDGAATLRLVGDVKLASAPADVLIREKIVRQSIKDRDVLGNFLKLETVQFPAEYVLHSCHSNKHWLPVFFYVRQVNRPVEEIIDLIKGEESVSTAVRGRLIDRLSGRTTARTAPSHSSKQIIKSILDGTLAPATSLADIRRQANAIQGWSDVSFPFKNLLAVLESLRAKEKSLSADVDRLSEIRRAAAWIDELHFKSPPATAT
jgi:hypothetical protein